MEWIWHSLTILTIAVIVSHCEEQIFAGSNRFAINIFQLVVRENPKENVIIAPAAIQSSLMMIQLGAEGRTASEIKKALHIDYVEDIDFMARLTEFQNHFNSTMLHILNGLFINRNLRFRRRFKKKAEGYVGATLERLNFQPPYSRYSAYRINRKVEFGTYNYITDVIAPEQLDDATDGILANGIVLIGLWQKAFDAFADTNRLFSVNETSKYKVAFMRSRNSFRFGDISELDAKVVELPYNQTDYAMLILLPNKIEGLPELEQKISERDILSLVDDNMNNSRVDLVIPQFSVSFGVNLKGCLEKLGVTTMFSPQAELGNLYRSPTRRRINSANYKAHLEFKHSGFEPPQKSQSSSSFIQFYVNHPFLFIVRHKNAIIFMGHIADYVF